MFFKRGRLPIVILMNESTYMAPHLPDEAYYPFIVLHIALQRGITPQQVADTLKLPLETLIECTTIFVAFEPHELAQALQLIGVTPDYVQSRVATVRQIYD